MKKTLNIIGRGATIIIMIFAGFVMLFTVFSVNTVGKDRGMFGYYPYIVLSDSMSGTFEAGDIILSHKTDIDSLKEGDIISFRSIDPNNYDTVVTHKIKAVSEYEGEKAFITYGESTGVEDAYPVPESRVIGEYKFRMPKMGYFFQFMKTPLGYFTVIFIPFMILIGLEAARFFKLFKLYKKEQAEELAKQKDIAEKEKNEALRMQEEIKRLKAQLAEKEDRIETETKNTSE